MERASRPRFKVTPDAEQGGVGGFMAGIYQKFRNHTTRALCYDHVNGVLSLLTTHSDGLTDVISIEVNGDRISAVYIRRNPDKLGTIQ